MQDYKKTVPISLFYDNSTSYAVNSHPAADRLNLLPLSGISLHPNNTSCRNSSPKRVSRSLLPLWIEYKVGYFSLAYSCNLPRWVTVPILLTQKTEVHKGKVSWGQKCARTRSQHGSTDRHWEQEAELRLPPTVPAFSSPPPRHSAVSGTTHGAQTGLRPITPQDSRLQQPPCPSRDSLPETAAAISRRLRAGTPASIPLPPWARLSIRISRCPALSTGFHQSRLFVAGSSCKCLPLSRPLGIASRSCKKKFPWRRTHARTSAT